MVAFVVLWVVVNIAAIVYFTLDRNAARKRLLWPIIIVGSFGTPLGFMFLFAPKLDLIVRLIFALVILLIAWGNLWKVKFCDNCGATVGLWDRRFFPELHCPKCREPLT